PRAGVQRPRPAALRVLGRARRHPVRPAQRALARVLGHRPRPPGRQDRRHHARRLARRTRGRGRRDGAADPGAPRRGGPGRHRVHRLAPHERARLRGGPGRRRRGDARRPRRLGGLDRPRRRPRQPPRPQAPRPAGRRRRGPHRLTGPPAPTLVPVAHLLGAEALHLEYPTRVVLDSVTLGVDEGDRIGIVGRNGDGKSSLLRLLSRRLEPDAGRVTWRGGLRVGVLDQSDTLDDDVTVGATIVGSRPEHEWAGDPAVRDVIGGLVPDLPWDAPVGTLSGGQRRRVALAALLVEEWDVVMLDEPTNHLDVEGISWLADHLKRRWAPNAGGLLVITHDRWFLDEVAATTWEVHDRLVEPFEGGY